MRVLVACEFSGRVREAFRARGHYAVSCDLEPSELPGPHYRGDVRDMLTSPWDLMIAFPPCTYLAASGNRWHAGTDRRRQAAEFVRALMETPIDRVAVENPIGHLSVAIRRPDQIIQPWQFGHGETKATCLWLKGLPRLAPTSVVPGREARIHRAPDSRGRARMRSLTYPGIAAAMANQWG